jgi:hypothetical protein
VRNTTAIKWLFAVIIGGAIAGFVACSQSNSLSAPSDLPTTSTTYPADIATDTWPADSPTDSTPTDATTDSLPTDIGTGLPNIPGHVDVGGCIGGKHLHICAHG